MNDENEELRWYEFCLCICECENAPTMWFDDSVNEGLPFCGWCAAVPNFIDHNQR